MSAHTVMDSIKKDAAELDLLTKNIEAATQELNRAEAAWDVVYDKVAVDLTDEYRAAGRKSDPAEHTILAATRRAYRKEYMEFRDAKRLVEQLQMVLRARLGALSGHQSHLKALRDEAQMPQMPQPAWSGRAAA